MATLSDRIKQLRKEKNLTQPELGKIIGMGKTTVSMYETGNSTPGDDIKLKMAEYFNVSIDYLMGISDIRNPNAEWKPSLSDKDNKDLDKIIDNFEKGLSGDIMLDGEILDDATKELLLKSVRNAYEFAKINNKAKYTPKKYRK
ncbi:MAG: helix-turn-helix transcriptional regulator [Clostridium sp.]|nr:helix-turn-helix transcriptional regulator [Clostridium sp.]